jgi:hypothetical protein
MTDLIYDTFGIHETDQKTLDQTDAKNRAYLF